MRMNGEKDGELREKGVCLYLFLWDDWLTESGISWIVNKL